MRPDRTPAQIRAELRRLIEHFETNGAELSRLLGRPPRYIATFLRDGKPEQLEPQDRARLARFFGVDEWELGGPGERPRD